MLNGKTALVTGASRGIGEAIALELAAKGADVAVNYSSDEKAARIVVEKIEEMGRKAIAIKANVSDFSQARKMVHEVKEKLGKIDLLVNNAGIVRDRTLKNMSAEEWKAVIATNLTGSFNVTKSALEVMPDGSSIVNISSVVGINGNFGQSNYSASKAGVIGFTRSLAKEMAKRRIRVNAVAPGFIETEMTKGIPFIKKAIVKQFIPLKRMGTGRDVSFLVAFLLSDDASYITGQVIKVDGGLMF